ncbi:carbohydrate binding family 9 domain-containing protein [Candidatus Poribacteria bacterium]|nr:carbohydrate binding family 9 domain-containing protein [Candidatus Poribacteria bacterium]
MCMLFVPIDVDAQTERELPRMSAHRISEEIKIDGVLDEPIWQNVEPIRQLYQIQPDQGDPATEQSEIRILYDDKKLYFGFVFFDSEMDKIVANDMRRDSSGLRSNDYGFLLLDTYNDRRNAVFFRFTPVGGMEDTAVSNSGGSLNTSWDIVWECRCRINEDNWTVEIAIPFSQLRFESSDSMDWGLNFGREIARKREIAAWNEAPKTYGGLAKYRTAYFGTLEGLEDISPSRHLELLPYILPGASYESSTEETEEGTEAVFAAGLDLKYGVTPNLTADLTFNTDFAQVEADQEQVNLTRFDLFFPEQRPFFLEGASIFDVGIPRPSFRRPPPLLLFYSRRIGLAEGRAIPILGGGKMTGKIGPYGIGILNVFTNKFEDEEMDVAEEDMFSEPRTNYAVVRVNRDILKGSTIGGIMINKQDADAYNRTAGLDFSYRPTREINIDGLWSSTFEADVSGNSNAFFVGGDWRTNLFRLNSSYTDIGEDYNPGVGFVQRTDIRRFRGGGSYTPWPNKFGVREIQIGPEIDLVLTQANELETREITFETQFEFETGDDIGFEVKNTTEHLDMGFTLQEGEIPEGDYTFTSFQASIRTSSSRMIGARLQVEFGEFYSGTRRGFSIDATARPNAKLSIEPFIEFNRITLPDAEFDANAFGGRVSYSFSTILFTKLFTQWSTDTDVLSANFLVNYIYRPGSDFYLVFDQNYDTRDGGIKLLGWTVVGKMTYWWHP